MNPIFVLYGEACNQIRCLLAPPPTLNPLLPKKKTKTKTKQNKTKPLKFVKAVGHKS